MHSVKATENRIKVLIVDDHPVVREALTKTINAQLDMVVCGEAATADEVYRLIPETEPTVVLMDIMLTDTHGLDLMQNLHSIYPDLRVVIFSMYDEAVYAERAIRAGAHGYVMKSEPMRTVLEAIRQAAQDEIYLSVSMASRIFSKLAGGRKSGPGFAIDQLTDRELEVFQLLGQGYSVPEIMERLHLSRKTVETYRRRAKEKLGFESVSELLQFAVQWACGRAPMNY